MNQETTISPSNNISGIFREIDKTIKTIGVERLIEILVYSRQNPILLTESQMIYAERIIEAVCDEFQITVDDLYSLKRKNNRRNAIGVCAYFFELHAKIDNSNSSYILKKPDKSISLYKKEIYSLNPKHPFDITILKKIENIQSNLKQLENA